MMMETRTGAVMVVVALALVAIAGGAYALTTGPFGPQELADALGSSRFHNEAGYRLGHEGSWASAALEFRIAITLDPSSVSARQNLAVASFHAGEYAEAIL